MKHTGKVRAKRAGADLPTEYVLDYSQAKPNRFAGKVRSKSVVVLLDPDVSTVFKDGESVNNVLRSLIEAMPPVPKAARR